MDGVKHTAGLGNDEESFAAFLKSETKDEQGKEGEMNKEKGPSGYGAVFKREGIWAIEEDDKGGEE